MADRGKAMMSEEELRREWEEEKQRRLQERVESWLAKHSDQPDINIKPPIPVNYIARPLSYHRGPGVQQYPPFPNCPPGFAPLPQHQQAEPSSQAPPASPEYTPASPKYTSEISVVTDWLTQNDLDFYWAKRKAPVPPNTGPWFRFDMGYVRFRYGTSWGQIDQREREAARERQTAMARGERVPPNPPPKQPGEVFLRLVELAPVPPAPALPEPDLPVPVPPVPVPPPPAPPARDDDSSDDEMDDEMDDDDDDEDSSSESEGEGENQAPPDWSDTSTITEEATKVPFSLRRFLSLRRRGRGRGRGRG